MRTFGSKNTSIKYVVHYGGEIKYCKSYNDIVQTFPELGTVDIVRNLFRFSKKN